METITEADTQESQPDEAQSVLQEILKEEDGSRVLKPGDIVEGKLVSRGTAVVFIDLESYGTGTIYGREFFLAHELLKQKDIGDSVSAKVVDPENEDGYVELSVSAAYQEIAWTKLMEAYHGKQTVTVEVDAANRGGLMAIVEGVKAFLPVSQLSSENYPRVEGGDKEKIFEALKDFEGRKLEVKIINADQKTDKLILSEKAVEEEVLRKEMANFSIGDTFEGSVSGVVDFGLFVKFGPEEKLEGLAHISELSWEPVENIQEQYSEGDKVKVKLIDLQGDKASLSLKALEPDPWQSLDAKKFAVGKTTQGRPVRFTSFGTFVEVSQGVQGIIRVNEFEGEEAMKDALPTDKEQTFTIVSLNQPEHRMELKLGEVDVPVPEPAPEPSTEAEASKAEGETESAA